MSNNYDSKSILNLFKNNYQCFVLIIIYFQKAGFLSETKIRTVFPLYLQFLKRNLTSAPSSVVDPELYVYGPPGSGSVIMCTEPDPSINK
jgi:hypothetical protein